MEEYSSDPEQKTFVAVWEDGTVKYTKNKKVDTLKVTEDQVEGLLSELKAAGFFSNLSRRLYFGPDSKFWVIECINGKRRERLASWHPLMESDKVVVVNGSARVVNGDREQLLKQQSSEYSKFLRVWNRSTDVLKRFREHHVPR